MFIQERHGVRSHFHKVEAVSLHKYANSMIFVQ